MRKVRVTIYRKNPHDISIRLRNKEHKATLQAQAKAEGVSLNEVMNNLIQKHVNGV